MKAAAFALLLFAGAAAELTAQQAPPAADWDVTLGAGAFVVPRYTGSENYQVWPLPLSQVTYRDRAYIGPSTMGTLGAGFGAYLLRYSRLRLGVEVALGADRPAKRDDALAGMNDRKYLGMAGTSLKYESGPVHGAITFASGLNDDAGNIVSARVGLTRFLFGKLVATTDLSTTFSDAQEMRREFGITPVEAARRQALIAAGDHRLRAGEATAYRPGAALSEVGGSVTLAYLLTQHWSLVGIGGLSVLGDEAARSPIVRQREQLSAGVGLAWHR